MSRPADCSGAYIAGPNARITGTATVRARRQGRRREALALGHHRPGAAAARHARAEEALALVADGQLDEQLPAHARAGRARRCRRAATSRAVDGDVLERLLLVDALEQHRGDVLPGAQPVLAPLRLGVQLGVGDGDAGRGGEGDDDVLVLLREAAGLLRQVELAEHARADAHRRARGTTPSAGARAGSRGRRGARAGRRAAARPCSGICAEHALRVRRGPQRRGDRGRHPGVDERGRGRRARRAR